ncbi:TetR family transcriptional regulator [Paenibacillus baekrokdamisoli]|uniref:TetR family transcriptional regulator n=1 Tax=Paenibacillus baekrokdamisoli TaxID=1712516 RepID=A0A3G9ILH0_9BACL|nr:TetR/AcrR family transcriptional regulator [Paenibacillus baekrokdamisoli]MBB3067627.1 AcrR family transcriptional regulator [Paenibacillus baekrokdamisoli]BBH19186.1 TetR family transcriptional regulator [Paenibacillus baekrokdamisoli]
MEGKKDKIIVAAIKCFSEKGYRGTSIQDIADSLGIAKGSMYFYFKSKDDLLQSICKHYLEAIVKQAQAVAESSLLPKEKLAKLIILSYEQYERNQGFISTLIQERFDIKDELHELIVKVRRVLLLSSRSIICEQYGSEAEPYACDAAVMFHAFIDGYLGFVILEKKQFNVERLSGFILKRLDELISGMIVKNSDIIMGMDILEQWSSAADAGNGMGKTGILAQIDTIRTEVEGSIKFTADQRNEITAALQVIEVELEKSEPQPVVIKGMLSLLKSVKVGEIKKQLVKLEAYVLEII